jgi:hypothetical protein
MVTTAPQQHAEQPVESPHSHVARIGWRTATLPQRSDAVWQYHCTYLAGMCTTGLETGSPGFQGIIGYADIMMLLSYAMRAGGLEMKQWRSLFHVAFMGLVLPAVKGFPTL